MIVPNVFFRDVDQEVFEDDPEEYIRRDMEGSGKASTPLRAYPYPSPHSLISQELALLVLPPVLNLFIYSFSLFLIPVLSFTSLLARCADVDTRRRAASDLVQALSKYWEEPVTQLFMQRVEFQIKVGKLSEAWVPGLSFLSFLSTTATAV